jgi:protein involved in polysaccharide export with SLBB domain
VTKILNRFENRIRIDGAVFRPNTYSFYEGMRISDLIAKAEGLKEDAYSKENHSCEIGFDDRNR